MTQLLRGRSIENENARATPCERQGVINDYPAEINVLPGTSIAQDQLELEHLVSHSARPLPFQPAPTSERPQVTLRQFYESRFLPLKVNWSEAYRSSFTNMVENRILPILGNVLLVAIDKLRCQILLNQMNSANYSGSYIRHARAALKDIFTEAVEQGYLLKSPARKLEIPKMAKKKESNIASEEQLLGLMERICDPKDKALFMVGVFCALRSSETFALPWRNYHPSSLSGESYFFIDQIAYRGKIVRQVKTDASKARVPIPDMILPFLEAWRNQCLDTSPDALMFPSSRRDRRRDGGMAMWPGQWLKDKLHVHRETLGLPFNITFRVLRRTASSIIQGERLGTEADVQALLRHSSPSTTRDLYTKPITQNVKRAANSYAELVFNTGHRGPEFDPQEPVAVEER